MTPTMMLKTIIDPGLKIVQALGGPMPKDAARAFLLTVAQQESGPGLDARYQSSPSSSPGPARGWWQFEMGTEASRGGVAGVFLHASSKNLVMAGCDYFTIAKNIPAIWRAVEGHDMMAVLVARGLILTDPYAIPTEVSAGWQCYAIRLWRPGKPHPEKWPGNWQVAQDTIKANPFSL